MRRICRWCGKEFESKNGRQFYCSDIHYDSCAVCGKQFIVPNSVIGTKERSHTCSRECRKKLREQTCLEVYGGRGPSASPEVQAKMRATTKERFGVEHAMQSKKVQDQVKQHFLDKYGAESYLQSEQGKAMLESKRCDLRYRAMVQQRIEESNIKKYGVKSILSLKEVRDKGKQTYKAKTGYEYAYQNPEVQAKLKAGSVAKFGTEYALQSEAGKQQAIETNLQKYGVGNPMQNAEIQEKAKQTSLEKYGVDNYAKTEEFRTRYIKTIFEKYGVESYSQTDMHKLRTMKDPSKFLDFKEFDVDPAKYISSHYNKKPGLLELANDLGVGTEAVSVRVARAGCKDLIAYVKSNMERQVVEFIQSLGSDIKIEENTHKVITPKEIDIYLPDYKFGIECNPASTHNSTIDTWDIEKPPMSSSYHKMKTDECEAKGVFLLHIFGYDWIYKQDVIKSMIRNILGKNEFKVYARKCEIKEVSPQDCREFLDTNHRQGSANSPIRLGLYHNDELVSLMTFGKMRGTIGTGSGNLDDCYELVRFCSKLNTSVVGGADKLFKHFVKEFHPIRIRSFSDRAHTRGTLYKKLGFIEITRSNPGYVWVNLFNDRPYHRMNAQKAHIREFLNDDTIDLSQAEKQIMETHNYVQVFDSGTITWEWTNR